MAGTPDFGLIVAVVDRQRVVLQRNAGDVGASQRQLLGGKRRKPRVVRAGADRSGEDEDFRNRHEAQQHEVTSWHGLYTVMRGPAPGHDGLSDA